MRDLVPLLLFLPTVVISHVALTFPEARFPPLDFLDTSRTMGPCGVPKPKMPYYSTLVVGSTYNFTWRMQYPHQGGYRLTLIDSTGQLIEQLVPVNGLDYAGVMDQTAQSERIRFSKPCLECTVILERQALEWGRNYRFRSCADVNILETATENDKCSGRGTWMNGACQCEHGYIGDICQYLASCDRDSDCMNEGKCLGEQDSLVAKTCYCAYGFFGKNCEQNFNHENDDCFAYSKTDDKTYSQYGMFNPSCYNKDKLSNNDFIYYRKIKNDVEMILDFSSTSWVSVGWRPEGLDPSCRLFPDLEGVRSKRATTMEVSATQTIGGSDNSEDASDDASISRLPPPPTRVAQEGPRPAMPKNNGLLDSALQANLHAMDCIDVLAGSVREGRTRVQDLYSRDRSTPLEDHWYDGEMSLVASAGMERDGRTVIMFRRNIQEIEPTDHPLGPGRMFAVWAKGQTQGAYAHGAPSALEGNHSLPAFYVDDQLKYHGSKNRGVHPIDFTAPVKLPKPSDAAFGVNIASGHSVLTNRVGADSKSQEQLTPIAEPQPAHAAPQSEPEPEPEPAPEPDLSSTLSVPILILTLSFLALL